ncbi:unnamed protein product [Closterium sp. Yama58-4]|nr:unnamed protein product [Closterium sp. Yama58-4]
MGSSRHCVNSSKVGIRALAKLFSGFVIARDDAVAADLALNHGVRSVTIDGNIHKRGFLSGGWRGSRTPRVMVTKFEHDRVQNEIQGAALCIPEFGQELKQLALEIEKVQQDLLRLDGISGETRALARKEALSAVQDIESRLKMLTMQVAKLRDEKLLIEEAMDGTTVQDLEENMRTLLQQQDAIKLQIKGIEGDMQNSIREREVHKEKVDMCMTDIENLEAQHNRLRDQLLSLNLDLKNAQGGIAEARERISEVVKVLPESEWKSLLHRITKLKHAKLSDQERKAFGERMSTLKMFKDRAASIVNSMKVLNEGISRAKSKVLMVNRDTYTRVKSSFKNLCCHLLPNKSVNLIQLGETVEDGIRIAFCNSPASEDSAPSWNTNLSQLSGGQRTLLSVALVLAIAQCSQNFVYLMDEVDAALDEENQSRVGALVQSELAKKGQVLCVSHNWAFQTFADSVVQVSMDNGSKISYAQLDSGKRAKHMGT